MRRLLLRLCYRAGIWDRLRRLRGEQVLTVLAYHRVTNLHQRPDFDTFRGNVSATPGMLRAQLAYVESRYHVISLAHLERWLQTGEPLPSNPLLITFDDGYRDNLYEAAPLLRAHSMPATIFLATDVLDGIGPFDWDVAGYCFQHTSLDSATLPLLGEACWSATTSAKEKMAWRWVEELKRVPDHERRTAIARLPHRLKVTVEADAFAGLYLSWDEARLGYREYGLAMAPHSCSHPILTRISLAEARKEIEQSRRRVEEELNVRSGSFAFPNGGRMDYSPALQMLLKQLGFTCAFTLLPGPQSMRAVKQQPLAIRRISVGQRDTIPRFAARLVWPRP